MILDTTASPPSFLMMLLAGSMAEQFLFFRSQSQPNFSDNRNCSLSDYQKEWAVDIEQIRVGLEKPGKSKQGLAKALGRQPSAVTSLLKGERDLKAKEIPIVAAYLDLTPTVSLVGIVGAGGAIDYGAGQVTGERVAAPDGSGPHTVAVEIRGDSLGELFDRWLVFYDDVQRPVRADLIGKLCVVGLSGDRVLIKKLQRSKTKRLFHLLSNNNEAPILDVAVEWAAKVKNMVPR